LSNVFRLAFNRLGHIFETRLMSEKELNQAILLGDPVARNSHHAEIKTLGHRII
jgi:hypothetical protein